MVTPGQLMAGRAALHSAAAPRTAWHAPGDADSDSLPAGDADAATGNALIDRAKALVAAASAIPSAAEILAQAKERTGGNGHHFGAAGAAPGELLWLRKAAAAPVHQPAAKLVLVKYDNVFRAKFPREPSEFVAMVKEYAGGDVLLDFPDHGGACDVRAGRRACPRGGAGGSRLGMHTHAHVHTLITHAPTLAR